MNRTAGVVVCGGQSRRMGRPKAWLEVRGQTLLARVVAVLRQVTGPVAVISAAGQPLPPLPEDVVLLQDQIPDSGPLAGLAVGLDYWQDRDQIFVSACDAPDLQPALIAGLCQTLSGQPQALMAIPEIEGQVYPLTALYRPGILPTVLDRLARRQLRVRDLADCVPSVRVPVEQLRRWDSELRSFQDVNTPEQFAAIASDMYNYDLPSS